jgi:hypothetical protein
VLRSLNTGDASLVIGRRTLRFTEDPTVELLMEGSHPVSFDGKAWSEVNGRLAIFDGALSLYCALDPEYARGVL